MKMPKTKVKVVKITERQLEVLKLLAEGRASKEIGDNLGLSKNTVDTYRRHLLKKTGSKNTQELVSNVAKLGLI